MSEIIAHIKRPNLYSFTMPVVAVLGAVFGFITGNIYGSPPDWVDHWCHHWGGTRRWPGANHFNQTLEKNLGRGFDLRGRRGHFWRICWRCRRIGRWCLYELVCDLDWLRQISRWCTLLLYGTAGFVAQQFLVHLCLVFFFLIAPLVPVVWLSFNAEDFFTFTPEMLSFKAEGYSLKHYYDFLGSDEWMVPLKNSLIIAPIATIISVSLGTLAAIGLSQSHVPGRQAIMAILISPMIVPLIISATGMFFFYAPLGNWLQASLGLNQAFVGYVKVILAHAVLGIPFVIITVTATLVGFDRSLTRAAANMGADPVTTFFRVQMPLILPGVISGGLFASSHRLMKWLWCCSLVPPVSKLCLGKCLPACVSKSHQPFWRRRRS